MLVNSKEIMMQELLDRYMGQLHMTCTCQVCKNDVLALSLNQVRPAYVTDLKKIAYTKAELVDKQKNTAMLVILAESAAVVSGNPSDQCETRQEEALKN
ncbi:competence protein ComFB [Bacillus halotolerans]|uniref:late competence development ComFB family protein n=1 Tax=Bacillus TaxID=1386 RepID=UPI000D018D3B|nr:late competence development ComFB family protein [Bacillus halotolerans]MDP4526620.1 late competence development ComFB family protein [Bacillus halotolerans]PRP51884.1 competence protein ComFB [Bacillus halotolerans]PRP55596.1 competence protein ComFB [Bacillus halotolerans]PRP60716.1 competence protein ComFB [Bacillus halotolerans]PRP65381.1 competence protein ComFB [Bacillus halotolerans]